jgi:aryl-alcohol dehydrogenase-like predicted oxidoreductase
VRDERRIGVVEQLIPLADDAGLPLTHLAMAFAIAHPGVTAALLGPRTMDQRARHGTISPRRRHPLDRN